MTDPLRPFADLIRALLRARAVGTASRTTSPASARPARNGARTQVRARSLQAHLKARIAESGSAAPAKLREAFVEAVILYELGEQIAPDPEFSEMVARVAGQLTSDPVVDERLHRVLTRLIAEPNL